MDFSGEVLSDTRDEGYFTVFGHAQNDHTGAELLPEAVYHLAEAFPVDAGYLRHDDFDAFDGLRFGDQFIELPEGAFALLGFQVLLELLGGKGQFFDGSEDGVLAHVELRGELMKRGGLALIMLERPVSSNGFDASDASGDGFLVDDFQDADVADTGDVRAAGKPLAVKPARCSGTGGGAHTDVALGIFVTEKGQRAGSERVLDGGDVGGDRGIEANFFVDLLLD